MSFIVPRAQGRCSTPGCDYDTQGFVIASPEGTCQKCEYQAFPNRFHGCLFCRRPMRGLRATCRPCVDGFCEFIRECFPLERQDFDAFVESQFSNETSATIEKQIQDSAYSLTCKSLQICKPLGEWPGRPEYISAPGVAWPGFYAGFLSLGAGRACHQWVRPHLRFLEDGVDFSKAYQEVNCSAKCLARGLYDCYGIDVHAIVQIRIADSRYAECDKTSLERQRLTKTHVLF